jgi:integrase
MRLTDLVIKALPVPSAGQVTHTDDDVPGFGVRVSQGGVKAFVLVYGRARRRATIGRYPTITLRQARKAAKELLAERTLGKREPPSVNFEEASKLFISTHFPKNYPKPRTKAETERLLNRHFLPSLRHEKLANIHKETVSRVIDRLDKTPSEARHALSAIRQFFNWATGRGYVARSPCEGLKARGRAVSRDRVLMDEELRKVLLHARSEPSTFHSIVQLLICTGQRRNEIASLRAEWIDFKNRTITLPATITKNKRQHTFPFGPLAETVLKAGRPKGLLFPARGKDDTVVNGWSKLKPAFDNECPLDPWTLHDLRRTCATNLAALGVPVHVTEKLLNHVSGTTGGIVAVYQRHAYIDEMREAIKAWENHLTALTKRRPSKRRSSAKGCVSKVVAVQPAPTARKERKIPASTAREAKRRLEAP